jgi:hypothetical protein
MAALPTLTEALTDGNARLGADVDRSSLPVLHAVDQPLLRQGTTNRRHER